MYSTSKKAKRFLFISLFPLFTGKLTAQVNPNAFQPFTWEWSTPNEYRLGNGAPGPAYWQQQADYDMKITVGAGQDFRKVSGKAQITYHNNSPHKLSYLWLQLDQNKRKNDAISAKMRPFNTFNLDETHFKAPKKEGGIKLLKVTDGDGNVLSYQVVETNLRIELTKALASGERLSLYIAWEYQLNDATEEGRSGYEKFSDGILYEIAQFYPRMCKYTPLEGWQNKPFYGPAEFALEFGNYAVEITVPSSHIVAATGKLQNPEEVLTKIQWERLRKVSKKPGERAYIISPEETKSHLNNTGISSSTKTWKFKANNVRDFAFASSVKFIWEAETIEINGEKVLAQSLYPPEAETLWRKYATDAILHTLRFYSHYTGIAYPYPSAIAVHGPVWGMEYPMISFCGGRPNGNGSYSDFQKNAMISVVIHEVGHNFFPMIVNNDERRWAWMDEGVNSFCQYLAEQTFEPGYPSRRGPANSVSGFMKSKTQNPIMTNPESIVQSSRTTYSKTAAGLNLLRNLVLEPKNFDYAFKTYAQRWAFKHPEPEDFFRTMEDASGMDLDWFWRDWFYGTEPIDMEITSVKVKHQATKTSSNSIYNRFYYDWLNTTYSKTTIPVLSDQLLEAFPEKNSSDFMMEWRLTHLDSNYQDSLAKYANTFNEKEGLYVYQLTLQNKGGCVSPVPLSFIEQDYTVHTQIFPAEIWIKNNTRYTTTIFSLKPLLGFCIDADKALLPDIDLTNNYYPRKGKTIEIIE